MLELILTPAAEPIASRGPYAYNVHRGLLRPHGRSTVTVSISPVVQLATCRQFRRFVACIRSNGVPSDSVLALDGGPSVNEECSIPCSTLFQSALLPRSSTARSNPASAA